MRSVTLIAVFVLLSSPASAEVLLRFKFQKGDVIRQKMTLTMNLQAEAQGRQMQSAANQTMHMEQAVDEVDANGAAHVRHKVTRIRMSLEAPFGRKFTFDSADENAGEAPPGVGPLFEQLVGAEFKAVVNPTGKMTDVEIPQELEESLKNTPGSPFGGATGSEGIRKMIGQSTVVFPEGAIQEGHTWTEERTMAFPFGEMKIRANYTYGGTNQDGLHVIKSEIEMDLVPGGNQQIQMTLKDQSAQGEILFDNSSGRIVKSTVDQAMTMEATTGGQTFEQQIKQTMTLEPLDESSFDSVDD